MYSEPAVERMRATDEVMRQRFHDALPLSYDAIEKSSVGGTRTHNLRLLKHVLRLGSRSCSHVVSNKRPTKWWRDIVPRGTP